MIGTLVGSGIAASLIYAGSKWQSKEVDKIQHVFRNINYKVGSRIPKLVRTDRRSVNYIEYIFSVPYGLVDDNRLQPILEKTLISPVKVMFKGKLIVRVYRNNLPSLINYEWHCSDKWTVPIGESLDGMIYHNFDEMPHMALSGTTRYGKTVLLKLIFAHLIENNPDVEFHIIDLKRLEFSRYKNLRQVKRIARTHLEAKNCLENISVEMDATMNYFENCGINNIVESSIAWRKFIIVDEGGQLDKSLHEHLDKIAMVGGGIGYRLIFATQYGTGDVFPRQVKQNSDAKIAFRLPTSIASRVALDEEGAERIDTVGRAIYRTADKRLVQVPYIDDSDILERLDKYVDSEREDIPIRRDSISIG